VSPPGVGRDELRQVSSLHRRSLPGWSRRAEVSNTRVVLGQGLCIGAAVLVMRLVESASAPTNWTGAQFVLASQHFDVAQGSPQPPGAWLYAAIGHAVHVVTGLGSVTSLVLLAAVASSAAAAATSV